MAFRNASIGYRPDQPIIRIPELEINLGDRLGVVGRSGVGKSTLLRSILEENLWNDGQVVIDRAALLRQGVGLVGQDQTLFPWKTARAHLAWATHHRLDEGIDPDAMLSVVGLSGAAAEKFPDALSGGMRRRLMLAMALTSRPSLLILDEAFGAIDYFTKADLIRTVNDYCNASGSTLVIVSHDMREIVSLANRVACIEPTGVVTLLDFNSLAVGLPFDTESISQEANRLFRLLSPLIGNEA